MVLLHCVIRRLPKLILFSCTNIPLYFGLSNDTKVSVKLFLQLNRSYVKSGEIWQYTVVEENSEYLKLLKKGHAEEDTKLYMRIKKRWKSKININLENLF